MIPLQHTALQIEPFVPVLASSAALTELATVNAESCKAGILTDQACRTDFITIPDYSSDVIDVLANGDVAASVLASVNVCRTSRLCRLVPLRLVW